MKTTLSVNRRYKSIKIRGQAFPYLPRLPALPEGEPHVFSCAPQFGMVLRTTPSASYVGSFPKGTPKTLHAYFLFMQEQPDCQINGVASVPTPLGG